MLKLETIVEKSKDLIWKAKKPLLIGTLMVGTAFSSCSRSQDYSTPEKSFESYVEVCRKQNSDEFIKYFDFNEECAEKIKKYEKQKNNAVCKELKKDLENFSLDVVETKYCFKDNEEIALIYVIKTNKQTNKKEEIYFRLVNDSGRWVVVDAIEPPLPLWVKLYDKSTIKDNTYKSEVLEQFKKSIVRKIDREFNASATQNLEEYLKEHKPKFDLSTPEKTLEQFIKLTSNKNYTKEELEKFLTKSNCERIKTQEKYQEFVRRKEIDCLEVLKEYQQIGNYSLSDKAKIIVLKGKLTVEEKDEEVYLSTLLINEDNEWKLEGGVVAAEKDRHLRVMQRKTPFKSINSYIEFSIRIDTYEILYHKEYYPDPDSVANSLRERIEYILPKKDAIKNLERCKEILENEISSGSHIDEELEKLNHQKEGVEEYIKELNNGGYDKVRRLEKEVEELKLEKELENLKLEKEKREKIIEQRKKIICLKRDIKRIECDLKKILPDDRAKRDELESEKWNIEKQIKELMMDE